MPNLISRWFRRTLHRQFNIQDVQLFRMMTLLRKEAEKLEFDNWPQASRFLSWKVAFRKEAMSELTYPKLAGQWLAEIDQGASMDESTHSGCLQRAQWTLDSKIVTGTAKIIPSRIHTNMNLMCWIEKQYREHHVMLAGRPVMFQIFAFFDINETKRPRNGIIGSAQH